MKQNDLFSTRRLAQGEHLLETNINKRIYVKLKWIYVSCETQTHELWFELFTVFKQFWARLVGTNHSVMAETNCQVPIFNLFFPSEIVLTQPSTRTSSKISGYGRKPVTLIRRVTDMCNFLSFRYLTMRRQGTILHFIIRATKPRVTDYYWGGSTRVLLRVHSIYLSWTPLRCNWRTWCARTRWSWTRGLGSGTWSSCTGRTPIPPFRNDNSPLDRVRWVPSLETRPSTHTSADTCGRWLLSTFAKEWKIPHGARSQHSRGRCIPAVCDNVVITDNRKSRQIIKRAATSRGQFRRSTTGRRVDV